MITLLENPFMSQPEKVEKEYKLETFKSVDLEQRNPAMRKQDDFFDMHHRTSCKPSPPTPRLENYSSVKEYEVKKKKPSNSLWWIIGVILLMVIGYYWWEEYLDNKSE